jgi:hypothetical protein
MFQETWYRRNRSRVYSYLTPIVCVYYLLPAIQYAFDGKNNSDNSGNLDLCYFNFRSALLCTLKNTLAY